MISILLPVYNAAPYLEECLQSILAQSHTDWELIAVDDFSSDGSAEVLTAFAARDGRIRVLENQSKGIIPALRLAYAQSRGDHITRMDADDIMPPRKLELMVAACRPEVVVTGRVAYFRSDGPLGDGYQRYADWLNGLVERQAHWQEIYRECVIPSPAWMMTRETLEGIGAFDSDRYPEDYDLVFRMYGHALEVLALDVLLHHWRDHGQRASRNDPNYSDNRFLDLKLTYFLQNDRADDRPLALWGAGDKGKYLARALQALDVAFSWHTDNPKKIGKDIYDLRLQASSDVPRDAQCLLLVASPSEQAAIGRQLATREDIAPFWFC